MTIFVRGVGLAGLLVALLAGPAFGHGWGSCTTTSYYYSSYYTPVATGVSYYSFVPVYSVQPTVGCVLPAPITTAATLPTQVSIYARPTPTPPSQTIEPPTGKAVLPRAPQINESRSKTVTPADFNAAPAKAKERIAVGFWNVSGRDVLLTVAGQKQLLPRNRSITLEVDRAFTWQLDQQAARQETVAADRKGMEIVIR